MFNYSNNLVMNLRKRFEYAVGSIDEKDFFPIAPIIFVSKLFDVVYSC